MKTVIEMAREAGYTEGELAWHDEMLERFAELVRADEREACAKVCDETYYSVQAADAIRARSSHGTN